MVNFFFKKNGDRRIKIVGKVNKCIMDYRCFGDR